MSTGERIVASAYAAMRGDLPVPRTTPGYCLRTVRIILEDALGWADEELYARFPDKVPSNRPHPRPYYSRDIQASLRKAGWGVPLSEIEPGALLFYWQAARNNYGDWVGHTGIYAGHGFVLENIDPKYREGFGAFSSGALSLTPLTAWVGVRDVEAFKVPEL
jgi:hypothetical protein